MRFVRLRRPHDYLYLRRRFVLLKGPGYYGLEAHIFGDVWALSWTPRRYRIRGW